MQPIYILQINTAFSEASIGISKDGILLNELKNANQYDHASFLQPAILEICKICGIELEALNAISVINGPGSYTGLRVGLASAKGICYALGIPLICINTLYWMASGNINDDVDYVCPMIDARRDEVYTALYDKNGNTVLEPTAMILEGDSFATYLNKKRIAFIGDGAIKCGIIIQHTNATFPINLHSSSDISTISYEAFLKKAFQDLAYTEPFYIKGFHSTQVK
jgi:tRNA threonylcarbamoyladenosine biosynthesis protein TsaB